MKRLHLYALIALGYMSLNVTECAALIGEGLQFDELIPREAYNPKTVETLNGSVTEVLAVPKMIGMGNAIVVKLATPKGDVYIVLGPDWFLQNQNFEIKAGDNLGVKGSKITFDDHSVIIASDVSLQKKALKLRDPQTGKPQWIEWRKGEEIFYKNYRW